MVSLLLGCGGSDAGEKSSQHNFKQGVGQLEFDFVENAPPKQIFAESDFKAIIKIDTTAAYDITDISFKILGLDPKYFRLPSSEDYIDTIEARSATNPQGGTAFIEFEGTAGKLFQNAEEYVANYFLKTNYFSVLEFSDTLCVSSSLYDVYDSGCKVEGEKSYSGQGAPVAISKLEEVILPGQNAAVEFRLFLTNKGKGKIRSISLLNGHLGGEQLECRFQRSDNPLIINLEPDTQEAMIRCTKSFLRGQSSYLTTLKLDLGYEYEVKERHKLKLIK